MNIEEMADASEFTPVPSGEGTVSGSRASDMFDWSVKHNIVRDDTIWKRSTGDNPETEANNVREGHQ